MKVEELKYNIITIADVNTDEHYTVKTLREAKEIYEIILETEREIYEGNDRGLITWLLIMPICRNSTNRQNSGADP